jgi:MoaA/NifB/PqqE/SkfB family radical SAM enzyme
MCDVGNVNPESNFFKNLSITGKPEEIPIERFKSIIDDVAPYRPMISITGTEPLLYKPIGEAISSVRHHGMVIAVTTSGYTLPKRAEELAEAGLSRLNVSIDGPPKLHNEIRGRKDSFEKATEGIMQFYENVRKKGRKTEILALCTITNMNYHALEEYYDSLNGLPIDRIDFVYMTYVNESMAREHNAFCGNKYHATVTCLNDDTRPEEVNVEELYNQIRAVKSKAGEKVTFLPDFGINELKTYFYEPSKFMRNGRCMVSWFIAQIIANGDVIPFTRCFNIPVGNINEQSFMEIWNGEKARAWRRDLRKYGKFPACTRCCQAY